MTPTEQYHWQRITDGIREAHAAAKALAVEVERNLPSLAELKRQAKRITSAIGTIEESETILDNIRKALEQQENSITTECADARTEGHQPCHVSH